MKTTTPDKELEIELINTKSTDQFIRDFLPESSQWIRWTHPKTQQYFDISLSGSHELSDVDFDGCFELIKDTSSADYRSSSVGWKVKHKKAEMKSMGLKYILVRDLLGHANRLVSGFLSFMLDMEHGYPVVYMYEIHLDAQDVQGTGLGTLLMSLLEQIAANIPVAEKIVFSCFTRNKRAVQFYEKRGYEVDEFSTPPRVLRSGEKIESDYIVMSKKIERLA